MRKNIYLVNTTTSNVELCVKRTFKRYKIGDFPIIKIKLKYVSKNQKGNVKKWSETTKVLCEVINKTKDCYYINVVSYQQFMEAVKQRFLEEKGEQQNG